MWHSHNIWTLTLANSSNFIWHYQFKKPIVFFRSIKKVFIKWFWRAKKFKFSQFFSAPHSFTISKSIKFGHFQAKICLILYTLEYSSPIFSHVLIYYYFLSTGQCVSSQPSDHKRHAPNDKICLRFLRQKSGCPLRNCTSCSIYR